MFALWVLTRFLWMPVNKNSIDSVFDSISGKIINFWEHVNVFYENNWEDIKKKSDFQVVVWIVSLTKQKLWIYINWKYTIC